MTIAGGGAGPFSSATVWRSRAPLALAYPRSGKSPASVAGSGTIGGAVNTHAFRYYRLLLETWNPLQGQFLLTQLQIGTFPGGPDTTLGMTATSTPISGAVTAADLIDDDTFFTWQSDTTTLPAWVLIDYGATAGNWIAANYFTLTCGLAIGGPLAGRWQGSDDASTFTDLVVFTNASWVNTRETQSWLATAGGSTSVNGSASGSIALTGTSTAKVKVQASGSGSLAFTGSGTAKVKVQASGSGSLAFTGSGTGAVKVKGSASGALPLTGASTASVKVRGSATGILPLTGTATESEKVQGAAASSLALSGSATGAVKVKASGFGSIAFTAAATARVKVRGSATGALPLTGFAASSGSIHGAGSGALDLAGSSSGKAAVRGSANDNLALTGSAIGGVAIRGALAGSLTLLGSAIGIVTGSTQQPTHQQKVLQAVKALLQAALPGVLVAGFDADAAQRRRAGIVAIGRGQGPDDQEPELGPVYGFGQRIDIDLMAGAAGSLDDQVAAIGAAIAADRTLGDLCEWLEATPARRGSVSRPGIASSNWATVTIIAEYYLEGALAA